MSNFKLTQSKKPHNSTWGTLRNVQGELCLVKEPIDPEKHRLRCMDAYAVDMQKFNLLRSEGGAAVIVRQVDGRVLCATLATFDQYGVPFEATGTGSQIALPLRYWQEVADPHFGEAA